MTFTRLHSILTHLDPHIKVSGDPENIKKAKEKIMAVLDTKVMSVNCCLSEFYVGPLYWAVGSIADSYCPDATFF